jgi:hypothetical protein
VLKRDRRELHGRLAEWLQSQSEHGGVRAGDVLAIVAHHYEAAADDARAAEFHARAAEHAAERFATPRCCCTRSARWRCSTA